MKILSFDVGIKNLAFCLNNQNDKLIEDWGILNISIDPQCDHGNLFQGTGIKSRNLRSDLFFLERRSLSSYSLPFYFDDWNHNGSLWSRTIPKTGSTDCISCFPDSCLEYPDMLCRSFDNSDARGSGSEKNLPWHYVFRGTDQYHFELLPHSYF